MKTTDVAIVGAGTAGAAAAALCARRGLSVVCLERRALDDAGARWINGVTGAAFDAAGLARPESPELFGAGHAFHLLAGWGPARITVPAHDVLEVDMRRLVARLQQTARDAGATLRGGVTVEGLSGETLHTSVGPITARWVVDASGLAGARLLAQPAVARTDLCAAAQAVYRVRDAAAARDYFERHAATPGETLCFSGVAGGYSIVNVHLAGDRVSVLTGSVPADGHASGTQLLESFVAEQRAWVGPREFGGARAIPLRWPHAALARGNVALLGDAGCQVFSAHGSGIGPGLVAARVLADALASGRGVAGYAVAWRRQYGGLMAAYDLFRRYTQTLRPADIAALMGSGLLDAATARAALEQRWPALTPRATWARLSAAARAPAAVGQLAPVLARMGAVWALHQGYPGDDAGPRGRAWSRAVARAASLPLDDVAT